MYIISIGNDMIFLVQFEINKHEYIFLKNNKIARALLACNDFRKKKKDHDFRKKKKVNK